MTIGPAVEGDESRKVPRPSAIPLAELGLSVNDRIEVSWEVELADGTEESVWWLATIIGETEGLDRSVDLEYEADHGFDCERRRVVMSSNGILWDALLHENLEWRCEGAADDEESTDETVEAPIGAFELESAVKARFQGGDEFHAGTIAAINDDGTYDVLYEDHVLEQGVPGEMIQKVQLDASAQAAIEQGREEGPVAETISDFFELFVRSLTSGERFSKLTAEQKAVVSDKVRALQPHFEAELIELRKERGRGAQVTGEDIKLLLPRVTARAASSGA